MNRCGQVVRLKRESREEYIRRHRAVWPTVLATIAECNIRNYSIFECGELLFGYFEYHGSDLAADMSQMGGRPGNAALVGTHVPHAREVATRDTWTAMDRPDRDFSF